MFEYITLVALGSLLFYPDDKKSKETKKPNKIFKIGM